MDWTFGAVGDVFVNRHDPENAFKYSRDVLREIDVVFGNCEGAYTDEPGMAPSTGWRVAALPRNGGGLADAGFDIMACANNHTLDASHAGLADTITLLRQQGIATVGAGMTAAEAFAAAPIDHNGLRIGFLAYASVYQAGYEARGSVPGLAAMRVHSHYYIPDWDAYGRVEPGAPPTVRTIPYPEDIERLRLAILDARANYDVVVASFHMGQASLPAIMADYEFVLARSAIDFGADIVLAHHHHFLRGVELYRSKPIFYGLGHFVFDLPGLGEALTEHELAKLKQRGEYAIYPRPGFPLSPFHEDARMTMIAICDFRDNALQGTGFVPCLINGENQAMPLRTANPDFHRIKAYVESISTTAGLPTRYEIGRMRGIDCVLVG
jgi:poly-gamma-glutamate capsule biosynthesis protein CapA/YwtB (metallophosphatase superfamily)